MLRSRDRAMGLKKITIIFVGGVALAAWFSAAMTPGRGPVLSNTVRSAPIDKRGAALAGEIARLRERLRPDAAPLGTNRNPFVFRSTTRSASTRFGSPPQARDMSASTAPVDPPRLKLSLAGIAEDPGPDGAAPVRTAIISGGGQLFLAKEGDTVTDGGIAYTVTNISASSTELTDTRDGTIRRLTLR